MIQNKTDNEIYTKQNNNAQRMSILLNEKAYATLSDTLYSNKERSVAREYITNAYDSHVDAGKQDEPFDVHCPTKLEPWFSVKDFGIGLNKEEVETIYSTYFLSTKETTNDTNGCFGLGSKSAFAVSNSFTVTSVKSGTKVTYSFFKDKTGLPTSKLVYESHTDEANGVEVKFAVDQTRVAKWQEEVSKLLCCFENVICNIEKDQYYKEVIEKTKDSEYGYYQLDSYLTRQEILMGDVLYPIDNLESYIKDTPLKKKVEKALAGSHVVLKANLGDLNISPSRESLSMDEHTTKSLRRIINKFVISSVRDILNKLEDNNINWDSYWSVRNSLFNTTYWDALKRAIFFNSKSLYMLDQRYKYGDGHTTYVVPFDFRIRSYRKCKMGYYGYTASFQNDPAIIVKRVEKPKVFYGEIRNITDTMRKAHQEYGFAVFHVENKDDADELAEWFCTEVTGTMEEYFPPKKSKIKKGRTKHGTLEDRYCLAKHVVNGVEKEQGKIDLKEEGLCYVTERDIGEKVLLDGCNWWTSNRFSGILSNLGYTKIIFMNKINKRKILEAGVEGAIDIVNTYVKKHKKDYIRKLVRKEFRSLINVYSDFINPLCNSYKKINKLKDISHLEGNIKLSAVKDTVLYKKERDKISNLREEYSKEYYGLFDKFPLLKSLDTEKEIEYYLKLEKAIK